MSKVRKILVGLCASLALFGLAGCNDLEQHVFFVDLGDEVAQTQDLETARASWTPEKATPAQDNVLKALADQAEQKEAERLWLEAVHSNQQNIRLNSFLTCVRHHESDRGSYPHTNGYYIGNSHGQSTSSGAYQFVDPTWRTVSARAGYPGYARALQAPDWVQDAVAYDTAIVRGERYHWNGTGC